MSSVFLLYLNKNNSLCLGYHNDAPRLYVVIVNILLYSYEVNFFFRQISLIITKLNRPTLLKERGIPTFCYIPYQAALHKTYGVCFF